ncbi:MAG: hypothetical protein ACNS60_12035 [Candidatus Cyclobacteriaceae bacterium M2_1C_046]
MRYILLGLVLISCSNNDKLEQYRKIVNSAEVIEIIYNSSERTIQISDEQIGNFKNILLRNIKPEYQSKFMADVIINFYNNSEQIGFLTISRENSTVNYNSDDTNFGFDLTYGIGMYLNDLESK